MVSRHVPRCVHVVHDPTPRLSRVIAPNTVHPPTSSGAPSPEAPPRRCASRPAGSSPALDPLTPQRVQQCLRGRRVMVFGTSVMRYMYFELLALLLGLPKSPMDGGAQMKACDKNGQCPDCQHPMGHRTELSFRWASAVCRSSRS